MQPNFDPAGTRGDVLSMVVGAPSLHEAHPNGAHFGKLVHGVVAHLHRIVQHLREHHVAEHAQAATRWQFTHRACVKIVQMIRVPALDKHWRL